MFTGINIFWARLRVGLARAAGRGLKWALRGAGPKPKFSILARKIRHNARKSDNNLKISIWCHQIQLNATPIVNMFGVLIFNEWSIVCNRGNFIYNGSLQAISCTALNSKTAKTTESDYMPFIQPKNAIL